MKILRNDIDIITVQTLPNRTHIVRLQSSSSEEKLFVCEDWCDKWEEFEHFEIGKLKCGLKN